MTQETERKGSRAEYKQYRSCNSDNYYCSRSIRKPRALPLRSSNDLAILQCYFAVGLFVADRERVIGGFNNAASKDGPVQQGDLNPVATGLKRS